MSKKVASLENISKTYGKEDLTVKALNSINLEIYKGDYLAVMGASGLRQKYSYEYYWMSR